MTDADATLQVRALSGFHGPVAAVRDVSLEVGRGRAVGILGPNGAGKSTLLAAIAGFIRSTGEVRLDGVSQSGRSAVRRRRGGIVLVPQQQAVIADLSVGDNFRLSWLSGRRTRPYGELLDEALEVFPALATRLDEPAGNLSGGQRQMLAVGRGLVADPVVLLLDEPTAGLSPKLITEVVTAISALNERGLTLLLVEQNFSVVERTCGYVHVINGGQISWSGPTDAIDRETVGDLYAGVGHDH